MIRCFLNEWTYKILKYFEFLARFSESNTIFVPERCSNCLIKRYKTVKKNVRFNERKSLKNF